MILGSPLSFQGRGLGGGVLLTGGRRRYATASGRLLSGGAGRRGLAVGAGGESAGRLARRSLPAYSAPQARVSATPWWLATTPC